MVVAASGRDAHAECFVAVAGKGLVVASVEPTFQELARRGVW